MKLIISTFILIHCYFSQDDIRQQLLSELPENWVKYSQLQEVYIRQLVSIENEIVKVQIPFDLHGLDCGAPDCYTTKVTFNVPLEKKQLPEYLKVSIEETGCIEDELRVKAGFALIESTTNKVVYYSAEIKAGLVIMKTDPTKEYVYYYTDVNESLVPISGNQELSEEFTPYRSTIMRHMEYDIFIK